MKKSASNYFKRKDVKKINVCKINDDFLALVFCYIRFKQNSIFVKA